MCFWGPASGAAWPDGAVSLLELGLVLGDGRKKGKVLVCCPEGYAKRGNVMVVCGLLGVRVVGGLEEVVEWVRGVVEGV